MFIVLLFWSLYDVFTNVKSVDATQLLAAWKGFGRRTGINTG